MSGLNALKLVAGKPQKISDPKDARRHKLCSKLAEQILLAKAEQSGATYAPIKIKVTKDPVTGESKPIEVPKKIKPWWWAAENGKICITLRYGAKTLEVKKGMNAIETSGIAEVVTTLQVLKTAVEAGELDAQIEALTAKLKEPATGRPTLTLKKPT